MSGRASEAEPTKLKTAGSEGPLGIRKSQTSEGSEGGTNGRVEMRELSGVKGARDGTATVDELAETLTTSEQAEGHLGILEG